MQYTRPHIIGILLLALLVIALPLTILVSQKTQQTQQHAAGSNCNDTGVTKNLGGTYTFALLHVDRNGNVVDQNNCVVHLLGMNTGNTYWGNAEHPDLAAMTFYKTHATFNVIRLNYQAYWWDTNVNVPDRNIGFQIWIKQIVTWAKSLGFYVILDTGPEYHAPPCGPGVPTCSPQNAGSLTNDPTQQIDYEPTAAQSLQELGQLYGNDPAIIWDVWNEPATRPTDIPTLISDYNERINTIRQYAPKSIVQVYSRAIDNGGNFTQGNIIEDFHDYSGADLTAKIVAAKSKGIGTIVAEYGGSAGPGAFMNTLENYAKQYNTNLVYYEDRNLFDSRVHPTAVTANGQLMSAAYVSIFGSLPPSPNPSIPPTNTPTPSTPSPTFVCEGSQSCAGTPSPTIFNGGTPANTPFPSTPLETPVNSPLPSLSQIPSIALSITPSTTPIQPKKKHINHGKGLFRNLISLLLMFLKQLLVLLRSHF